jgi:Acyl-CoA reductase (LuxC).
MDQFGCSSPNTVFWLGKNQIQKKKFWMELKKIVDPRYDLDLSSTNKKISNLINFTISKNKKFKADLKTFSVIKIKDYKIDIQKSEELNFGTFFEVNLNNLRSLKNFTSIKLQTVTYFGLKYKDLIHFITENNIKGIDRVVPIGRSFDLTTEWDGTDIINSLSRTKGI